MSALSIHIVYVLLMRVVQCLVPSTSKQFNYKCRSAAGDALVLTKLEYGWVNLWIFSFLFWKQKRILLPTLRHLPTCCWPTFQLILHFILHHPPHLSFTVYSLSSRLFVSIPRFHPASPPPSLHHRLFFAALHLLHILFTLPPSIPTPTPPPHVCSLPAHLYSSSHLVNFKLLWHLLSSHLIFFSFSPSWHAEYV